MYIIVINTPYNIISLRLKIDENIPTTLNFTEEDTVHALSQTNESEEIELESQTETEKPPSSLEKRLYEYYERECNNIYQILNYNTKTNILSMIF